MIWSPLISGGCACSARRIPAWPHSRRAPAKRHNCSPNEIPPGAPHRVGHRADREGDPLLGPRAAAQPAGPRPDRWHAQQPQCDRGGGDHRRREKIRAPPPPRRPPPFFSLLRDVPPPPPPPPPPSAPQSPHP